MMDKFKLIGSFLLLVIVRIVVLCFILTFLPVLLFSREKTVQKVIWNMYELIKE